MNLSCEKIKLQEAISIVQKSITGKSTLPILQGILLIAKDNTLTLIGSNIDLSIETKIEADITTEGQVVVDARLFGEIIKKLPNDEIQLCSAENNAINITCNKSNATLIHMDAEEYPSVQTMNENNICSIPQKLLKNMIRSTIFAIAQDETRPILTGILFEINNKNLNLVALDGYRLALRSEEIDNDNFISTVIPGKTLSEVSKILHDGEEVVDISVSSNHILFNLGNTKVMSRLLEGEFIRYNSIIPQEYNLKLTVKREDILSCIERASLMGKDGNTNMVKLNITDEDMVITSNSQLGKFREELSIILQGEALQIAFNSRYLIDVFKIMDDDEITMEFSSSVSPCIIRNKENDNCIYLVLPVRMPNDY